MAAAKMAAMTSCEKVLYLSEARETRVSEYNESEGPKIVIVCCLFVFSTLSAHAQNPKSKFHLLTFRYQRQLTSHLSSDHIRIRISRFVPGTVRGIKAWYLSCLD